MNYSQVGFFSKIVTNKKNIFLAAFSLCLILVPSALYIKGQSKASSYARAKKLMDPDLYLVYRIADRIITSNNLKRPIRFSVSSGSSCLSSAISRQSKTISGLDCSLVNLLPDIDKSTNFEIWAARTVGDMIGTKQAYAYSDAGFVSINRPMLKDLIGKPDNIACVLAHEIAHVTQDHAVEKRKILGKYENIAAQKITDSAREAHKKMKASLGLQAALAGFSSGYTGDSSALNNFNNRLMMENLTAQLRAPQIAKEAMKYSPVIGAAINETQGLNSYHLDKTFNDIDNYMRDVNLAVMAHSRAKEYEADLLGLEYLVAAGFKSEGCIEMWTEIMPHNQDKIIQRLLPEGTPDPGKEPNVFDFEVASKKEEESSKCTGPTLKCKKRNRPENKWKGKGDVGKTPTKSEKQSRKTTKANKKSKSYPIPPEIIKLLTNTHPTNESRAVVLENHLKNKTLFARLTKFGERNRSDKAMRYWKFDENTNTVIVSSQKTKASKAGKEEYGLTGIDIDEVLGF